MSLFTWLENPPDDRGMRVLDRDGSTWRFHSYAHIAILTRRAAWRLRAAGVSPGDVVLVIHGPSPEFMAEFFGALLLGATPSPVAPPAAFRDRGAYLDHVARIIGLVRARVIATTGPTASLIEPAAAAHGCGVVTGVAADLPTVDDAPNPPETGLIQFSSGSTGPPRGVRIPFAALQSNVSALYEWLLITDADSYASWLPLHHDMGLIGLLMLPIEGCSDVWLMQPEDFIRAPLRWLECFGAGRATMTATPTFGLSQITRRVRPDQVARLDLSGWRGAIVGAERIDAQVVAEFLDLLAPCGLRREVIVPAYGLAESTLAVTGAPCGADLTTITVHSETLSLGREVTASAEPRSGTTTLVGCGAPIRGVQMRVIEETGAPAGAGVLGEIEVWGESLATGYVMEAGGETEFAGRLRTGDAGFVVDGNLFVVGRIGDGVKQFGRWFFAEEVEQVAAALSPRPRQTVALVGDLNGRHTAAVLVEGNLDTSAARIGQAVAKRAEGLRVLVLATPAGAIARTTSGKPKRRAMWRRLGAGEFVGTVRWDSHPA